MSSGSTIPIVAGLIVGIAFILVFALMLKPVAAMTDDELRRLVSNQYPQFKALEDRYPETTVKEIQRTDTTTYVQYSATKEPRDENSVFPGPKTLGATLQVQRFSGSSISVYCGSGVVHELPATVNAIQTTDCLETP